LAALLELTLTFGIYMRYFVHSVTDY